MKNKMFVAALLLAGFSLAGCAVTPEEMKADIRGFELPKFPEAGKAIVYVVRPSVTGEMIRFDVFLDDQLPESQMGWTHGSQYIYFNLLPGDHQILSKAENWAEIKLQVEAGDIVFIQQDSGTGIKMAWNSLARIQDYEGRYQVKHLTLGKIVKTDKGIKTDE